MTEKDGYRPDHDAGQELPEYAAWIAISHETTEKGRMFLQAPGVTDEMGEDFLRPPLDEDEVLRRIQSQFQLPENFPRPAQITIPQYVNIPVRGEAQELQINKEEILRTKNRWQIWSPGHGGIWARLLEDPVNDPVTYLLNEAGIAVEELQGTGELILNLQSCNLRFTYDAGEKILSLAFIPDDQLNFVKNLGF